MIELETIANIKQQLVEHGVDEQVVSSLRSSWPEIHFTYCSEDDIHVGRPVEETALFSLYLVDSREHCLCLTTDHSIATGVVVAENYAEDVGC